MTTWADVASGQSVMLNGREWSVVSVKSKGAKLRVTVSGAPGTFSEKVKPTARVELSPLHRTGNAQGSVTMTQTRWATPLEAVEGWAPRGKVEKRIVEKLGGRLVSETVGGVEYVPAVDPSTIAAHLWIYHDMQAVDFDDFASMAALHNTDHESAPGALHVPHTHSRNRPPK